MYLETGSGLMPVLPVWLPRRESTRSPVWTGCRPCAVGPCGHGAHGCTVGLDSCLRSVLCFRAEAPQSPPRRPKPNRRARKTLRTSNSSATGPMGTRPCSHSLLFVSPCWFHVSVPPCDCKLIQSSGLRPPFEALSTTQMVTHCSGCWTCS